MKKFLVFLCAMFLVFAVGTGAHATIMTIEPDDFFPGQNLSNVLAGVTLSVADGYSTPQPTDQVIAFESTIASTGNLVFGKRVDAFVPDQNWFLQDIFVHSIFRADFDVPVDQVSIDIIRHHAPAATDSGAIIAFNALGTLLDTTVVSLVGEPGTFATATINRSTADIAYILAGGYPVTSGPPWNVAALDNFTFNEGAPIPEPTIDATLVFFDESVENGTLEGRGYGWLAKLRLCIMREMLVIAGEFIENEQTNYACYILKRAYKRCDGESRPRDFVVGDACDKLNGMIQGLIDSLCGDGGMT